MLTLACDRGAARQGTRRGRSGRGAYVKGDFIECYRKEAQQARMRLGMRRDAARRMGLKSTADLKGLGAHDLPRMKNGTPCDECGALRYLHRLAEPCRGE
jgi:hypothetical protein